ncbi:MAG TPA: choline dehydrogenase [Cyanothece sp. UBA12306]|nr:choline dehydrogenase [Cyanothece sp. UBA12306]
METKKEMIAYDLIIVGSGNGACGFLSHYLLTKASIAPDEKILVIEEGQDFFNASDITHQNNWTQSYGEENIFKLHNTLTPSGIPIISGRACTMGGGGSINYTMIHESSQWLSQHIGHSISYWDQLKNDLNQKFFRPNPLINLSPVTQHILDLAIKFGFKLSNDNIENIPNYHEGNNLLLHPFPTQFNRFGQRTNSGVSLVDWSDSRITLKTQYRVECLQWEKQSGKVARCVSVETTNLDSGQPVSFTLASTGKLLLCAGAATPRLLIPHQELLSNNAIGKQVSDHIVLPLGIYLIDPKIPVTGRDVYVPLFATTLWQPEVSQPGKETVFCFDFFSGNFEKLWYLLSHLYLAFLLPNWFKKIIIRVPWLFYLIKNSIRILIGVINFLINILWGMSKLFEGNFFSHEQYNLITAIVKFNPESEGYYDLEKQKILLNFFSSDSSRDFNQDLSVAEKVIVDQMKLLNNLGKQPHWLVKLIIRLLTKIPYNEQQVGNYIKKYSQKFLLSEQHLSGGCLFGKAIDQGIKNPSQTGKVFGTSNVYVADLSAVPLPRISPQMTAYLIGFHVAQKFSNN